jgi:PKD repeat protein
VYEVRRDWTETGVTWNERDAGAPWQVPGLQGPDDRGSEVLGTIAAHGTGPYVIDLNAAGRALVQRWIDDPCSNHGLVVGNYAQPDSVQFAAREAAPGERPRLALLVVPSRTGPGVTVAGPLTGTPGVGHAFAAYVRPLGTSPPITYAWQATDQVSVTHVAQGVIDTRVYTWALEGVKTIWLTVTHAGGTLTGTHTITVARERPVVRIAGPPTGTVGAGHAFTAHVRAVDASQPITYAWRATGQGPVTRVARGVTDTQVYTWTSPGYKTVWLTVTHAGGAVTGTHAITVVRLVGADFDAWPRWGVRPLTVAFTNTSSCTYTASLWDFGDGSTLLTTSGITSTLPGPTHTYTSGGVYTVTLTVSPVVSGANGGPIEVCTTTKVGYIVVFYENLSYLPVVLNNDD